MRIPFRARRRRVPATAWRCDDHPGRRAVTHWVNGGGGHGWACRECVPPRNYYDALFLDSADDACPWPDTHRRCETKE